MNLTQSSVGIDKAMKEFYRAYIVGNQEGIYIIPGTNEGYVSPEEATNFKDIDFDGVNHLMIYRNEEGNMTIAQACGYTLDRGIFTDLYKV